MCVSTVQCTVHIQQLIDMFYYVTILRLLLIYISFSFFFFIIALISTFSIAFAVVLSFRCWFSMPSFSFIIDLTVCFIPCLFFFSLFIHGLVLMKLPCTRLLLLLLVPLLLLPFAETCFCLCDVHWFSCQAIVCRREIASNIQWLVKLRSLQKEIFVYKLIFSPRVRVFFLCRFCFWWYIAMHENVFRAFSIVAVLSRLSTSHSNHRITAKRTETHQI